MIKIGTKKDLPKISHLPMNIQNAICEDVEILDCSYGENRNIDVDMGGFVVVCNKDEKLDIVNFNQSFDTPEYIQEICPFILGRNLEISDVLCPNTPFSGVFDGNGFTITIDISSTDNNIIGLFSENTGTIKNLNIIANMDIALSKLDKLTYIGGITGQNSGTIENCTVKGNVKIMTSLATGSKPLIAGGVVGYNSGNINSCSSKAVVSVSHTKSFNLKESYAGGIVGYNSNGTIFKCYSTNSVSAITPAYSYNTDCNSAYAGGIVGYISDYGEINQCYSNAKVSASAEEGTQTAKLYAGGLVGCIREYSGSLTMITDSYSNAFITTQSVAYHNSWTGGIVGYSYGVNMSNCYTISSVSVTSDTTYKGALIGNDTDGYVSNSYYTEARTGCTDANGTGKSLLGMKLKETYKNWDFENVWSINSKFNANYPYLKWQTIPAESILLNKSSLSIQKNEIYELIATVTPDIATNKSILWTTSDSSIATVTDGRVKGINGGTATITATAIESGVRASCEVVVSSENVELNSYTINDICITDMSGNIIIPSKNDKSFYAEIDVTKNTADISKDMLIVALYSKANTFISMTYMKAVLAEGQNVVFGGVIPNLSNSELGAIKGFVWNNVNSMTPLSNVLTYDFRRQNPIVVDEVLESAHPYDNSIDDMQVYEYDGGCICIDVTFTNDTMLDDGYDFIYLYDENDNLIGKYTGRELAGKTIEVTGNTVKIRHTSDNRITDYGYKTESIVVYR